MSNRILRIVLRVVGVAGLLGILVTILMGQGNPLENGSKAPHVNARALDGARAEVSFTGLTVVNIWGTWCPPCLAELPDLIKEAHKYEGKVRFIGLAVDSPREDITKLATRLRIPYDLAQIDGATMNAWHASAVPDTYIIDAGGLVRWSHTGGIDAAELDGKLAPLLH